MMGHNTIVDRNDEVISYKPRNGLDEGDIYRISALWLMNSRGRILLAQRAFTKKNDPGRWSVAASGTVEQGETYESNMIKEAEEELGLRDLQLELGPKLFVPDNGYGNGYFCQFFFAKSDLRAEDLKVQEEEVAAVRWIGEADLLSELRDAPDQFSIGFAEAYNDFTRQVAN